MSMVLHAQSADLVGLIPIARPLEASDFSFTDPC